MMKYIMTFAAIGLLEAIALSWLINFERYPWVDSFKESLTLSFFWNLLAMIFYLVIFKVVVKNVADWIKGVITAIITAGCYYLLIKFTYTGNELQPKVLLIMCTFFVGAFLIPYMETWMSKVFNHKAV